MTTTTDDGFLNFTILGTSNILQLPCRNNTSNIIFNRGATFNGNLILGTSNIGNILND